MPSAALQRMNYATMRKLYTFAAILFLNTVLLFVAVNLVAGVMLAERADKPVEYPSAWLIGNYGFDVLKKAYPGWQDEDLRLMLTESSNWLLQYEPFTQFRPATRSDRYITIHPAGFRASPPQGPWPPAEEAINLFVFGGSTTMGAGVPDKSTIPAQLQARIASSCSTTVNIYNFGRGFYYSTQERILFEQLLLAGTVPDMALFIDGLTDFYFPSDTPQLTGPLGKFVDDTNRTRLPQAVAPEGFTAILLRLIEALPAYRLWLDNEPVFLSPAAAAEFDPPRLRQREASRVIERWRANQRMIRAVAGLYDIPLLFVWAPAPTYGYDLDFMNLHVAGKLNFGAHALSGAGYELMAKLFAGGEMGDDFLWLGDLQKAEKTNLYVDTVHYDEAFSGKISDAIFERLAGQYPSICIP